MLTRRTLTFAIVALMVASCGGGGGGPRPNPIPPGDNGAAQLSVGQISGPASVDEGQSATFSVSASGVSGITYNWSVSPASAGSFGAPTSASTSFTAGQVSADLASTIQVVVAASGQGAQTRTKAVTIANVEAAQAPHIASVAPLSGTAGQQVTFIASVTGSQPLTYSWNFGGGASPNASSLDSPTVVLGDEGSHSAYLIVSNDVSADTYDFTLSISSGSDNLLPEAVASASPTTGKAPLTVSFNGNASQDPDGTIARYEWDFDGDGTYDFSSYSTGLTEHVYNEQGPYLAILRVTDDDGGTDIDSIPITVSLNIPPVAGTRKYELPQSHSPLYSVWVEGAYDPDGYITLYEWDWQGDGLYDQAVTSPDPIHPNVAVLLENFGNVVLRVTDNDGATATAP